MIYENAKWNSFRSIVDVTRDGVFMSIPAVLDNQDYVNLINSGTVIADFEPPAITAKTYAVAIQSHLDLTAQGRGFDDADRCATYATGPIYGGEAQAFVAWRDSVWFYANVELSKVQTGQRAAPTAEAFILELPAMVWP